EREERARRVFPRRARGRARLARRQRARPRLSTLHRVGLPLQAARARGRGGLYRHRTRDAPLAPTRIPAYLRGSGLDAGAHALSTRPRRRAADRASASRRHRLRRDAPLELGPRRREPSMRVLVVGAGPAGLSAATLLA